MQRPILSRRTLLQSGSFAALAGVANILCAGEGNNDGDEDIKFVFVLRRPPDMSLERFHDHWKNQHARLVKKYAKKIRIRKYTQSHTLIGNALATALGNRPDGRAAAREILEEPYDGVAELWWRRADLCVFDEPIGQEAVTVLLEDERKFVDFKRSNLWWTTEHVIVDAT